MKFFFCCFFLLSIPVCASTVILESDGSVSIDGTRHFVYGFYGHSETSFDFSLDMQAGVDFLHNDFFEKSLSAGYNQSDLDNILSYASSFLDDSQNYGIGVALGIPQQLVISGDVQSVTNYVNSLKAKGSLWFWILFDNPNLGYLTNIQSIYNTIKSLDSDHPIILINTLEGFTASGNMGNYCDFLWLDSQCLPFSQTAVAFEINELKNHYPSKAIWPVLQARSYLSSLNRKGLHPAVIDFNDRSSSVTSKSIRGQAHAAISSDAMGIVYRVSPSTTADFQAKTPDLWQALVDLGAEIQELESALLSSDSVPSFTLNDKRWGRTLRIRGLYGDADKDPSIGLPTKQHVLSWQRMYQDDFYIGIVSDYMCLNRMDLYLPFDYGQVNQYPGNQAVIYAVSGDNPSVEWDKIPVAIWDMKDNNYIQFVLQETDSLVWSFSTDQSMIPFSYSEDFAGTDGSQPSDWTLYLGDVEIDNNQYVTNTSAGTTQISFYNSQDSAKWKNYTVDCDISQTWAFPTTSTGTSSLYTSVLFRVQDNLNYYMVRIRKLSGSVYPKLEICRVANTSSIFTLSSVYMNDYFSANNWYKLNIAVDESNISAVVKKYNDTVIGSTSALDISYAVGTVGIRAVMSGSNSSKYDNLSVSGERTP